MKKFINDPINIVDEMVEGILLSHPDLARLGSLHVLIRRDIEVVRGSQVTILSGGGSGHEPAHAGYIGAGMLSGAILGGVFASPSTTSILAAIRAVAGPKGVLLVVKNYTGDRINFGQASLLAQAEGKPKRLRVNSRASIQRSQGEPVVDWRPQASRWRRLPWPTIARCPRARASRAGGASQGRSSCTRQAPGRRALEGPLDPLAWTPLPLGPLDHWPPTSSSRSRAP